MTLLHEAVDTKKMDVRLVERNVSRGVMTADDVEKNLKKLPDDADAGEFVSIDSLLSESDSQAQ